MTDARWYWPAILEPKFHSPSGKDDPRASVRVCQVCEGVLFLSDPAAVNDGSSSSTLGHDPDCPALALGLTLGSGNPGGGGSGAAVNLGRSDITLGTAGITLATLSD